MISPTQYLILNENVNENDDVSDDDLRGGRNKGFWPEYLKMHQNICFMRLLPRFPHQRIWVATLIY